jgi:hypothetical protein
MYGSDALAALLKFVFGWPGLLIIGWALISGLAAAGWLLWWLFSDLSWT